VPAGAIKLVLAVCCGVIAAGYFSAA
jgi:hypothetical protein